MEAKKRKYVLFNKDDGRPDAQKPCAFFITPQGCRNGAKCQFLHGDAAKGAALSAPIEKPLPKSEEAAVMVPKKSSKRERESTGTSATEKKHDDMESGGGAVKRPQPQEINVQRELELQRKAFEDDMKKQRDFYEQQLLRQHQQQVPVDQQQDKKKRRKSNDKKTVVPPPPVPVPRPAAPVMAPQTFAVVTLPSPQSLVPLGIPLGIPPGLSLAKLPHKDSTHQKEEDEDTQFLFGAVNSVLAEGHSRGSGAAGATTHNTVEDPFVHSESVLRLLQTSGTKHATLGSAAHAKHAKPPAAALVAPPSGAQQPDHPVVDEPRSAEEIAALLSSAVTGHSSLPWDVLVQNTKLSARFQADYQFEADHTWVQTRPHAEWLAADNRRGDYPTVIAIDCEMCETSDPVTGLRDPASLVRVSVINGIVPAETLLDSLVVPTLPVTDWRTQIHGIAEKDLAGITFTLRHAQAFILNLCSDRTIIVGHAVHHDLKALRIKHDNVIDTAYFYTVDKEPGHHASVRDISEQVLGVKLPQVHDSVQDARAALQVCEQRTGSPPVDASSLNAS
jgi:hypothetical protein